MSESGSRGGLFSSLLYIVLIGAVLFFIYQFYKNNISDVTFIPKDVRVTNYVPADFRFEFNEDDVLAILTNPHRYQREFNGLVYDFNKALLLHVARRMNLTDSLQRAAVQEYDSQHPYLRDMYFRDFVSIKDTSAGVYEDWYQNNNASAVEIMKEVAGKYTCYFINSIILKLVENDAGVITARGKKLETPCGVALGEALGPMIKRLEKRAAVIDFSRSRGMIAERVEKLVAELATVEVRDKKAVNRQTQTKVFGYAVSSSDIELSAMSILKVGFKLDNFFDVQMDERTEQLRVTLPAPVILSHEVYPRLDKLDIGWMREVKELDFNENMNVLRQVFRKEAYTEKVRQSAKERATEVMKLIFQPVTSSLGYSLDVQFQTDREMVIEEGLILDPLQ